VDTELAEIGRQEEIACNNYLGPQIVADVHGGLVTNETGHLVLVLGVRIAQGGVPRQGHELLVQGKAVVQVVGKEGPNFFAARFDFVHRHFPSCGYAIFKRPRGGVNGLVQAHKARNCLATADTAKEKHYGRNDYQRQSTNCLFHAQHLIKALFMPIKKLTRLIKTSKLTAW
jgi:hypothetical protein